MTETAPPVVPSDDEIVRAVLAALPDVVGIWFYGSGASGRSVAGSDLDIGLIGTVPYSSGAMWEAMLKLMSELRRDPIDLVDLRKAGLPLRFAVFSEGRRLFASDELACDVFENSSIGMYQREQIQRAPEIKAWLERFAKGYRLTDARR